MFVVIMFEDSFVKLVFLPDLFYRAEEISVRLVLAVWPDYGHCCSEDCEDEGSGVCDL